MRILVLEHEPEVPAALLADWAASRGHELDVVTAPALARWPALDGGLDAIVSLGSQRSVHASCEGWIRDEVAFLRAAHARRVPILGICFGGQALALALGGSVGADERPEVTWRLVCTLAPELITPGPWFLWHEDFFTLPPGARLLAGTESRTVAFAAGPRSVGVQFHPEVDGDLARYWIDFGRAKLASYGVDISALEAEVELGAPAARGCAFDLFDRWAAFTGLTAPPVALAEPYEP